jgi:ketosteroid isomerase-like protein
MGREITLKIKSEIKTAFIRLLKTSIAFILLAVGAALPAAAELPVVTTQETLLDRIQIEDMLLAYYHGFESEGAHDWAAFYADDAILDINGVRAEGKKEIQALYDNYAEMSPEENVPGKVHVLMTNPRIIVTGDTATAHMIYTETINDTVYLAPRLIEQGREDTWFKKVDGHWLITKRYITQDGGLPPAYMKTYKER